METVTILLVGFSACHQAQPGSSIPCSYSAERERTAIQRRHTPEPGPTCSRTRISGIAPRIRLRADGMIPALPTGEFAVLGMMGREDLERFPPFAGDLLERVANWFA